MPVVDISRENALHAIKRINENAKATAKAVAGVNEFYNNHTLSYANFKRRNQNFGVGICVLLPMFKINLEGIEDIESKFTISCKYNYGAITDTKTYIRKQSGSKTFGICKSGDGVNSAYGFNILTKDKFRSMLNIDSNSFYVIMRKNSLLNEYEFYLLIIDLTKYSPTSPTLKKSNNHVFWNVRQNKDSIPASIIIPFENLEVDPILQPESILDISPQFYNFYDINSGFYDEYYLYISMTPSSDSLVM